MQAPLECFYAGRCQGCAWIGLPYPQQQARKQDAFVQFWAEYGLPTPPELNWVSIAPGGLRDRTDLVISTNAGQKPQVGLFQTETREILDLESCSQLTPSLQEWLARFRTLIPQVQKGSVRLRVAPYGTCGVWLDFANIDVKNLLDEKHQIAALMEHAVVEIGQKRKRVVWRDDRLKLVDPELFPWFETYSGEKKIPLYCTVGSFTQPGFKANRALVETLLQQIEVAAPRRILEFGSGIGNFTVPLALSGAHVTACEVDALACQGLQQTLIEQNLQGHVEVKTGNFQIHPHKWNLDLAPFDAIVVDPPRSGLMQFLDPLIASSHKPRWFFYVSCFADSFSRDSERLLQAGYKLRNLSVVDQFPQSPHFEIVASFEQMP